MTRGVLTPKPVGLHVRRPRTSALLSLDSPNALDLLVVFHGKTPGLEVFRFVSDDFR